MWKLNKSGEKKKKFQSCWRVFKIAHTFGSKIKSKSVIKFSLLSRQKLINLLPYMKSVQKTHKILSWCINYNNKFFLSFLLFVSMKKRKTIHFWNRVTWFQNKISAQLNTRLQCTLLSWITNSFTNDHLNLTIRAI